MNQEAENNQDPHQHGQSDELNANDVAASVSTNTNNVVKEVIDGIADKVAAAESNVALNDMEVGKVDVEGTHVNKEVSNNPTTSDGQSKSEPTSNSQPPEDTVMDDKESEESAAANKDKNNPVEEHNQTTKDSTEDSKDDMEVDEINTDEKNQEEEESDNNSLPRKNSSDLKSEALARELSTKPERRTSKRQRANRSPQGSAPKKIKAGGSAGNSTSSKSNTSSNEDASDPKPTGGGNVDSVREWSEPTYQWIEDGVKNNNASTATTTITEHAGVEIDFSNTKPTDDWTPPPPFVVNRGDVVLLCSGDTPWNQQQQQNNNTDKANREAISIYNDPASRGAGLGALDPFIGVVERLWEEEGTEDTATKKGSKKKGGGKNTTNNNKSSSSKMMMRTRWFFKREELDGIKGSFIVVNGDGGAKGNAKDEVLATLSSQDLVLTDQSDVNLVSTIMGKAKVIKKKPVNQSDDEDVEMADDIKGTYVCRYSLSLSSSSGKDATVKFYPCTDGEEFDSSDPTSTDDDGYTSPGRDDTQGSYNKPFSPAAFPLSPQRRLVSEGISTVGKILVGSNHQADIPKQFDLQRKSSFRGVANAPSQRMPIMVWDPSVDESANIDDFLVAASSVITNHLKEKGLEPFHETNYIESPNHAAEANKPREANIDSLLMLLHECRGLTSKAIQKVSANPEKYMILWDKKEKEQFDSSYRVYRESIRMIANTLGDSKSCKESVDYQYRFKFCENFRRFMRKKHDKAQEMMATVEDRMLNAKMKADARSQMAIETETSGSEEEVDNGKLPAQSNNADGEAIESKLSAVPPAAHPGSVNSRVRTWFKTGGGDENAVGATQQRRNKACGILSRVMEKVGDDAYDTLANAIKSCNTVNADSVLPELQATAKDVLKSHPELLNEFMSLMPKALRV